MRIFAVTGLVLLAAGCVPTQPRDSCGASNLQYLIGQRAAAAHSLPPGMPVRILRPNTPRTQDYRPNRVNINVNRRGRIGSVWCG